MIVDAVQVEERVRALGFRETDARTLADHFLDAERRGKRGHGFSRVEWLATLRGPRSVRASPVRGRRGRLRALGGPRRARLPDAGGDLRGRSSHDPPGTRASSSRTHCFPTGMLGYWVRQLAAGGLSPR